MLEHAMKVAERIFEHRIRQQIDIDDMQFGFMKGKGTTDEMVVLAGMRVNMNKTMLMIGGERQKAVRWHVVSVVEAFVILQYSVLVVRSECT